MSDQPGVFVLSLDTEFAWGTFDQGGLQRYAHHFNQERDIIRQLLAILDKYHAPATWAFVGHLLLDHCERSAEGTTHPGVLRPRYQWYPHDWHHYDPGTDVHRDPWWYAPDALEMVLKAKTEHEIGTHTFSHIVVDDPDCTRAIFRSQIEACVELHHAWGLNLQSIVYPRNKIAFLDTLAELGITVYRGRERSWYEGHNPHLARAGHIADRTLAITPPTYSLAELPQGNLVNVPASMFYLARDGFRRLIPIASRVVQAKRGLRRAAARGELFHLWFHPFNLGSDPDLMAGFDAIIRYAYELRDRGQLTILTMQQTAQLAQRYHQQHTTYRSAS